MYSSSELPDFLATVSQAPDPDAALSVGVTRFAETFDAEVAAAVGGGEVLASTGFARGSEPGTQLLAIATGTATVLDIAGVGPAYASVVSIDSSGRSVVIARVEDPLDAAERAHAQAMARVLALALQLLDKIEENERLVREHQAHEAVLEAILRVQRLISQRRDVDAILQAITGEAATLLGADLAGICLSAPDGIVRRALAPGDESALCDVNAIPEHQLLDIGRRAAANELLSPVRTKVSVGTDTDVTATVVGAPVHDDRIPIGGLYVLAMDGWSQISDVDVAAVQTFASQASIALTDASTVDELHHAFHDTLTGLPNRALFQDRFKHAHALGERMGTTTALLFIDLDRFKSVNDSFGHTAGDQLLTEVANGLSQVGRSYDSVARLGGDEFAMVLEDTTAADAELVARRLLDRIGEVKNPASSLGHCSASIGIAITEADCNTTDELLRRADIAMYAAKAQGRSCVALYRPAMGSSRLDHKTMAEEFTNALARDEFVVHYQPIVSLQTRQIVGAEALLRWLHPERGMLNPADFIQGAEDTGMIIPIGRWVLQVACQQAAQWRKIPGNEHLSLNVNISGRQLQSDGICDDARSALDACGLEPAALTLEVTESIFVDDVDAAGTRLRSLKDLGVKLAIDDFGTGFSSLSYIHHYPFDVLKIDRTFVHGLGTTANGGALVKTLLALGQQLSMTTIAEGIENPVELAQLRAMRCSYGQGFLFSRPIDANRFERLCNNIDRRT